MERAVLAAGLMQPFAADFVALLLGSAKSLPSFRGLPANIAEFGRYKVRPTLRKQPDVIVVFSEKAKGIVRNGLVAKRIQPASPAAATTSRQVRRYLTREFDKDRKPLRNNIVQVLRARQMAERNEARLAERAAL